MKRRTVFAAVFLAVLFLLGCFPGAEAKVSQSQIDALREKTEQIEQTKRKLQADLDTLQKNKAGVIAQKEVYDKQIAALNEEIDTAGALMSELSAEIALKTESLDAAIAQESEGRVQYETRVAAMQKMGSASYLSLLLDAGNFSDFLTRWEAMRRIMDHDEKLAETYRKACAELKTERAALEAGRREQTESRERLAAAQKNLAVLSRDSSEMIAGMLHQEAEVQGEYDEQYAAALAADREREALEAEMQREIEAEIRRVAEERRRKAEEKRLREAEAERLRKEEEERRKQEEQANASPSPDGEEPAETPKETEPEDNTDPDDDPYIGGGYIWPVPGHSTVSSSFGWRVHPVYGYKKFHTGIDIPAPKGTKIVASGGGTILLRKYNGGYGNCIVVYHGGEQSTLYGHMSSFGKYKEGDTVKKGAVIGYVGTTGVSTGNHLHFEVIIESEKKNPLDYVSPGA